MRISAASSPPSRAAASASPLTFLFSQVPQSFPFCRVLYQICTRPQVVRVADDLRSGDIQKVPQSGGLGVLVGKIVIVKTIVLV